MYYEDIFNGILCGIATMPIGCIMNMAFAVSAAYAIGDHLAFTMIYDRTYLVSVIVGKLVSGITSLVVACLMYNKIIKAE